MYARGGPLPYEIEELRALLGEKSVRVVRRIVNSLIDRGQLVLKDGYLSNDRATREIDAFHERRRSSAKGGRATKNHLIAKAKRDNIIKKDVPNSPELSLIHTQTSPKPSGHLSQNQIDGLHPPPSPSPSMKETPSNEGAKNGADYHEQGSRRGTRLDPNWAPSAEDRAYATSLGYDEQVIDELVDDFRFYWTQGTGRTRTMASWNQCWQVWCRNDRRRPGSPAGAGKGREASSAHQKWFTGFARAAARKQ